MTPSFQEAHISQIPAIRLLQQLGYTYLSPEEVAVERRGRFRHALLEDVLARQLRRLNFVSFKGGTESFTEENIAKAVAAVREVPFDGLVRTSERVYDLLTLGKSLDQEAAGHTRGFTLRYIDWANPRNNVFHVTAEFELERTGIIANRTKRTITEKMEEDPFFYRKLSALLQEAIDAYRAQRINEAEYLDRVREILEQIRDGNREDAPAALRQSELATAYFGALKEHLATGKPTSDSFDEGTPPYRAGSPPHPPGTMRNDLLADVACDIEEIIRRHAVVRWRDSQDAQNRMRNDLDDLLFRLQQEKGVALSFTQMDSIIESILRITRNRQDV